MRYFCLAKGGVIEGLAYHLGTVVTIVGNVIYLVIYYYLWKAIYVSSPTAVVNGMTFTDTLVYVVLARAMFYFMECYLVWTMGRNFQSGQITIDLIKPIDYQVYMFFYSLGGICLMCLTTFIPTFIIVYYASGRIINLDINVPYYALSIMLSIGINFCINFFVGTICFYTGSIWGVNMMKEVIVSLLSGATIPLAFFPDELRKIVDVLPFHSIYNTPLTVLVDKSLHVSDYNSLLCEQLMWLVVLAAISRIFFLIARKNMTVNGG